MRIAVNTRLLLNGRLEGLGRFACETLKIITKEHPEHEFIFIFDRQYDEQFIFSDNILPVVAYPQSRHPVLWYFFFEWGIPYVLKRYKADLFLSPDGWLSLRSNLPSVAVIHDLNFFHEPEWISPVVRKYYNHFFPKFIRRADRIATVSEYSANDISSLFEIEKNKIDIVYNGVNENLKPSDKETIIRTRNEYTQGRPYFLFLGLVHPRKNLTRIIHAFELYKKTSNNNTCLLVAGSTKYQTSDTREAYENSVFKNEIIFAGRLPENRLMDVIGSALALVYASLFEGFGIPILEAMACGVPVITSGVTSMPEVGGNAALYIDPLSAESISGAMLSISNDPVLKNELIRKGFIQKEKFSWKNTAGLLWNSIGKIRE